MKEQREQSSVHKTHQQNNTVPAGEQSTSSSAGLSTKLKTSFPLILLGLSGYLLYFLWYGMHGITILAPPTATVDYYLQNCFGAGGGLLFGFLYILGFLFFLPVNAGWGYLVYKTHQTFYTTEKLHYLLMYVGLILLSGLIFLFPFPVYSMLQNLGFISSSFLLKSLYIALTCTTWSVSWVLLFILHTDLVTQSRWDTPAKRWISGTLWLVWLLVLLVFLWMGPVLFLF